MIVASEASVNLFQEAGLRAFEGQKRARPAARRPGSGPFERTVCAAPNRDA